MQSKPVLALFSAIVLAIPLSAAVRQSSVIPISCGLPVDGVISAPSQRVQYAFDALAGDRIYAALVKGSGVSWNPKLDLLNPLGQVLTTSEKSIEAVLSLPGTYILQVRDGSANGHGDYRLRLDWIAPLARQCGKELRCGDEEVGATFENPFRSFYQFEGSAGDRIVLGVRKLNGVTNGFWFPNVRLYDPRGLLIGEFEDPPGGNGPRFEGFALHDSGSFTVAVGDNNVGDPNAHGAFRLFFDRLGPPERACAPLLACGETATGSSTTLGDVDLYQFEGRAGDRLRVEVFEDKGTTFWSPEVLVYAPDATVPLSFMDDFGSIQLPQDGTYCVVLFDRYDDGYGQHRLQLERYAPTDRACGPVLACGIPVRGTLVEPQDHDFVYFDAEAGDLVDITVEAEARRALFWSPRASLLRPDGGILAGPFDRLAGYRILATGRYALEIRDGGEDSSGAYGVRLEWLAPTAKQCPSACVTPAEGCGTGRTIEVVDANDANLRDLLADPGFLARGGRAVEGLAADGVTPVLLRIRGFSGPGTVSVTLEDDCSVRTARDVGSLRDPLSGASSNSLTVPLVQVPGITGWLAFAVLTAPLNFAETANAGEAPFRKLHLRASAGSACATRELWLFRPPLVLVHGIWGAATTWTWRSTPLDNGAGLRADDQNLLPDYVYVHDYRLSNGDSAAENAVDVRRSIASALLAFRGSAPERLQLAATQVDLVAHSYGGVITRHFLSDPDAYFRADNFLKGDVHKFVTLGTSHFGSPWADLLMELVQSGAVGDLLSDLAREFGFCLDCGAVEDLQEELLADVPAAHVFTHAVVGTGGSDYLRAGEGIPERLFEDETSAVLNLLSWVRRSTLIDLATLVFGDDRHDMLVAEDSARGGLPLARTSPVGFLDGFHTFLTKSFKVEERTRALLDSPIRVADPAGLFQYRLPSGSEALPITSATRTRATPSAPTPSRALVGAIEIRPLLPLTGLEAGDAVAVEIVGSSGFQPIAALVLAGLKPKLLFGPPFEAICRIPPDGLGVLPIAAVALGAGGSIAVAAEVVVSLDPGALLRSVSVTPDPLDLFPYQPEVQLALYAHYDDATTRALAPGASGTRFLSLHPQIATVDAQGRVRAVSEGVATIQYSYADSRGNLRSGQVLARSRPETVDAGRASAIHGRCGENPDVYTLSGSHGGRPVLGGTLSIAVDLARTGHTRALIQGVAQPGYRALPGGQIACVDTRSRRYFGFIARSTPLAYSIPTDPALEGLRVHTQAWLQGGAPLALTNTWTLRLGAR